MIDKAKIKRILIVRTDRIGDVVLSSCAVESLRENFKNGFIAMMVTSETRELVEGNPCLDEVIVYDKKGLHRSILSSLKFAFYLRKKKIDMALILHPTNRVHIISFLAGIPIRVGYNRKFGFLLTHRIEDEKYKGRKHEVEYNLDVLRRIGLEVKDRLRKPYVPIKDNCTIRIGRFLRINNIGESDILIGLHPGASCPQRGG